MKVVFANPPVIRSERSSAQNDFKIDGYIFKPFFRNVPGLISLLRFCGIGKGVRYGVRAGSRWPWTMDAPHGGAPYPFIMGYAASLLRKHGIEVALIDAVADEEYSYQQFLKKIIHESADIVVIECSTPTIDIDLWIAKKISQFAQVCLAGPHLTTHSEQTKKDNLFITYLLKGEYILSCLEMARTRCPGIYESHVVEDLDSLPFPYRDYPAAVKYFEPTMPTKRPQLQIYASKGCPFKCTFCMWPQTMYNKKVAYRKPERVAEEIRFCIDAYGYRSILFDDDTFNIGTDRISRLCDELKIIGLPWTMMGRLDCSPTWLLDKMVDTGCVGMRFGIETFNVDVLSKINKGIEKIDFQSVLAYIAQKYPKLMIHVTMMKDIPGQTQLIHEHDMMILRDMGFTPHNRYRSYQLSACAPFPGTAMHQMLLQETEASSLDAFKSYDGGRDTITKNLKVTREAQ